MTDLVTAAKRVIRAHEDLEWEALHRPAGDRSERRIEDASRGLDDAIQALADALRDPVRT